MRGSCVDCEERDAVWIDDYKDELCSTCYTKRIKNICERQISHNKKLIAKYNKDIAKTLENKRERELLEKRDLSILMAKFHQREYKKHQAIINSSPPIKRKRR